MRTFRKIVALSILCCGMVASVSSSAVFAAQKKERAERGGAAAASGSQEKVDLNTASKRQLDDLPGIGPALAKKIVAGRPYSSVSDLSKSGIPANTIAEITPLVTVGSGSGSTADTKPTSTRSERAQGGGAAASSSSSGGAMAPMAPMNNSAPMNTQAPKSTSSAPANNSAAKSTGSSAPSNMSADQAKSQGMVWVNLETRVFHDSTSRFYGKTKKGKYMKQADAVQAGYRAAKNEE